MSQSSSPQTSTSFSTSTLDLQALTSLSLSGRHLIEASAGTGKTYNITKLYIRLLLEKALPVQQILVMTFTKAATEELRGRIEEEVRRVYEVWGTDSHDDDFLTAIALSLAAQSEAPSVGEVRARLKQALLDMDEAAVYTIHGFCSRVLTQEAFASGLPMELTMEVDTSELLMASVRDWFRWLGQEPASFALLEAQGWHTPERFLSAFGALMRTNASLNCVDEPTFIQQHEAAKSIYFKRQFETEKSQILTAITAAKSLLFSALIEPQKEKKAAERLQEWDQLIGWLQQDALELCPKAAGDFINGNRYRGKEEIKAALEPFKALRKRHSDDMMKWQKKSDSYLEALPANELVAKGIYNIRERFREAKDLAKQMDFDDLISHLSHRLQAGDADKLTRVLRQDYPVALVDEFQDTDPEQYSILDKVYPRTHAHHALFMIGDPKQAIYSFRGGDVYAYLQARQQADYQWHMDTNWRSLAPVVDGYNRLFFGRAVDNLPCENIFGNGIHYEKIHFSPTAKATKTPLIDPDESLGGINFVWLPEIEDPSGRAASRKDGFKKSGPKKDDWMMGLTRWCVAEIDRLLNSVHLGDNPVEEKDIAILVRTSAEAEMIRTGLQGAGYPSVYLSDRTNVIESDEAWELLSLLEGVLECESDRLLIRAIATRLWGGDTELLSEFTEDQGELAWEEARGRAIELRDMWRHQGCMKMLMSLMHEGFQPDPDNHERSLTNYLHLMERVQHAARRYRQPQQLLKWYRDQCMNPGAMQESEQRLESDANLIRIITQHSSKGLEYPLVFIPYACTYRDPTKAGLSDSKYCKYHDPDTMAMTYQLGGTEDAFERVRQEGHDESIRLFYVAVTRASHRCYIGVAPFTTDKSDDSHLSGLGLTLGVPDSQQWRTTLDELVATSDGCNRLIEISSEMPLPGSTRGCDTAPVELKSAILETAIDDKWKLASYSTLKKLASQQQVTPLAISERQDQKDRDASLMDVPLAAPLATLAESLPLRFSLKKGSDAGDLLHDILEHADFSAPDWQTVIPQPLNRFDPIADYADELAHWLDEILDAKIPRLHTDDLHNDSLHSDNLQSDPHFRLRDLSLQNTLREAEFYFTMNHVEPFALEALLRRHRNDGRGVDLSKTGAMLNGMMHGFIDLIFEESGRYYVADYKSSHLGDTLRDYHVDDMRENINKNFYDLQYLIYSLALHRYLKASLPHYQPEIHFGGVYYFYLRGMSAAEPNAGVYSQLITLEELDRLDRLFGHVEEESHS